jgi:hypothetical protein
MLTTQALHMCKGTGCKLLLFHLTYCISFQHQQVMNEQKLFMQQQLLQQHYQHLQKQAILQQIQVLALRLQKTGHSSFEVSIVDINRLESKLLI